MPTKFQQETLKSRFAQAKVLVVGDVMLDRYWFGDVSRISPEAPVPVAKISRIDQRAGGAANVARNIASLGGKAGLLSVTGDDEAADALDALMAQDGVSSYLMRDKQIATTVKLRVVARLSDLILKSRRIVRYWNKLSINTAKCCPNMMPLFFQITARAACRIFPI